jgi:dTDP-4-amino-4,6-dideoxygalactose transaminase
MQVRLSKCSISSAEINAVTQVLESEFLGMGSKVVEFEQSIKQYLDTNMDVVCVNTGTSALQLALSALNIQEGDEVLVPSLTYIATFQAISAMGAIPIACEVNSDTLFIDVHDAETRVTPRTRVIMPVHYASSSKGMSDVYVFAKKYQLRVIEDAAQAFGCFQDGNKVGVLGDIVCFSFDGIKNITAGEGGAILTSDKRLIEKMQDSRLLGVKKDTEKRASNQRSWDFDVESQGFRFHMSNINAAIGIEQLKRIDFFKEKRQLIAKQYIEILSPINEVKFLNLNYEEIVPHIFVIKVKNRDGLRDYLLKSGIECGVHYKPNHMLKMYSNPLVTLSITESLYSKIISLPCHVDLSLLEQDYVIQKIGEFYNA